MKTLKECFCEQMPPEHATLFQTCLYHKTTYFLKGDCVLVLENRSRALWRKSYVTKQKTTIN